MSAVSLRPRKLTEELPSGHHVGGMVVQHFVEAFQGQDWHGGMPPHDHGPEEVK